MVAGKKILWLTLLLIAVALGGFFVWQRYFKPFDPSVDIGTFKTEAEYQNYIKNLDVIYAKDTYGGKTPEETLQLFIDALKKGDTDLAAKYFIPEKQKQETGELREGVKSGGIAQLLQYYEDNNIEKTHNTLFNEYEITVHNKNSKEPGFSFRFVLNKTTNIWKIESL